MRNGWTVVGGARSREVEKEMLDTRASCHADKVEGNRLTYVSSHGTESLARTSIHLCPRFLGMFGKEWVVRHEGPTVEGFRC